MEQTMQKRIDQAWAGCKKWITEFTGTPTAALLTNTPAANVAPGFGVIAGRSQDFRITVIPEGGIEETKFIPLDEFPDALTLLLEGKLNELSVSWGLRSEAFELDLHAIIHPLGEGLASIQIDWWNDQVFSVETDNPAQFAALAEYFLELQELFGAANLFISSEGGLDPAAENEDWIEI
jgi:hypothetical protein